MLLLKKVSLISLGCAKNQVDSEVILGNLKYYGYQLTSDEQAADVIIINTCGFIEDAKEESIDTILQVGKLKELDNAKTLVVCGCLSQRYKEELKVEIPEIDLLLGIDQWDKMGIILNRYFEGKPVTEGFLLKDYLYSHESPRIPLDLTEYKGTAYIKIAEGCDNHCSYCAIPLIRGNYRSRSIESIKKEAERLAKAGVKEINLIAQETTRYGLDYYGEYKLTELLQELTKIPELTWIRFLYGHPARIDQKLIAIIAEEDKICPYLDLPLQHINDKMLKRMNRKGSKNEVKLLIDKLRKAIPDVVLRTSFMVGFPGEKEEDFKELLDFIKEIKFDYVGIFKYSKEENTPAAELDGEVDEGTKDERYKLATELQQKITREKRSYWTGKTFEVLVDSTLQEEASSYLARTKYQAPEVDGSVIIPDSRMEVGSFAKVKITQIIENDLIGEINYESGK